LPEWIKIECADLGIPFTMEQPKLIVLAVKHHVQTFNMLYNSNLVLACHLPVLQAQTSLLALPEYHWNNQIQDFKWSHELARFSLLFRFHILLPTQTEEWCMKHTVHNMIQLYNAQESIPSTYPSWF